MKYIRLLLKPSIDETWVERFLKAIRSGPVYFCVVYNKCLYKSNVVLFDKEKYNIDKIRERKVMLEVLITIFISVKHVILK